MKSISQDYQKERIKNNQKFLLKLLHLRIGNYYPLRKYLGIDYKGKIDEISHLSFGYNTKHFPKGGIWYKQQSRTYQQPDLGYKLNLVLDKIPQLALLPALLQPAYGLGALAFFFLTTYTYQPSTKDTRLDVYNPNTNYGNATTLYLQPPSLSRFIMHFDISDVPDAVIFSQGDILIYRDASDATHITAYRLTRTDWVEAQATWNSYKTGSTWTTAGGDYTTTNSVETYCNADGWQTWNAATLIQDCYNNQSKNVHLLFNTTEKAVYFYSKEHATTARRPKLTVTYTAPQNYYQTCPEVVKILPVNSFNTSRILNEAIIVISFKISQVERVLIEALSVVSNRIMQVGRILLEGFNITDVIVKVATLTRTFTEILQTISLDIYQTSKTFVESLNVGVIITNVLSAIKTLIETIKVVPAIVNVLTATRTLTENVIIVPVYSGILTAYKTLTETIKTVGSIIRDAGRTLSDILIIGDLPIDIISIFFQTLTEIVKVVSTIGNSVARVFTETIKTVVSLLNQATLYKILTETIKATGQILRNVGRIFIEVLITVSDFIQSTSRTFVENIKVIPTLIKQVGRIFLETSFSIVELVKTLYAYRTFTEIIKVIGIKITDLARVFIENIIAVSYLIYLPTKRLLEHIVVLPVLGSFVIGKLLIQSVKIIGDLLFSTTRVFIETLNIVGQRIFLLSKNLIETVTATIQQFNFSLAKIFNETIIVQWFKETYRAFVYLESLAVRVIFAPFTIGKVLIERIVGITNWLFGKTQFIVLTDVVKVVVGFIRTITRVFIENVKLASDVIIKYMGRLFGERLLVNGKGFQDEIHLLYGRVLSEVVNVIGALGSFAIGKLLPELIKVYDSVAKASAWVMTEVIQVLSNMILLSGKIFTEIVNVISSKVVDIGRIFTERTIITPTIGFKHTFYQILTDSVKVVSSIIRTTGRTLQEVIIVVVSMGSWVIGKLFVQPIKVFDTDTNVWQLGRLFSETIKVVGNVFSQSVKVFTEIVSIAGTFILGTISKVLIEVVKIYEIITKTLPAKIFIEAIIVISNVLNQAGKIFVENINIVSQFVLGTISKLFIEPIKIIESYSKIATLNRVFTETVNIVVSAVIESGRIFKETVNVVGTFVLGTISKLLLETVHIAYSIAFNMTRVFAEVIVVSMNIIRQAGRVFAEIINIVGTMAGSAIAKTFTATINVSISFTKVISRTFTQTINVIGAIFQIGTSFILYETVKIVGALQKFTIAKLLKETISVGWAKIKLVLNGIQVGLWKKVARVTGGIWRKISRNDN